MKKHPIQILVPGIFAVAALVLAVGAGAQMTPPADHAATMKAGDAAPMADPHAAMKADCQAMMTKKQEMKDKLQAMDVTLDKLVAEMNAAKTSKDADAMEKPMAAVLNELVAQRKATHAMTQEMDAAMMAHMMGHRDMGEMKDGMDCPMMKAGMKH